MNPQTSYFGVAVYCSATLTGPLTGVHCGEDHPSLARVLGGQQGCLNNVFARAAPVSGERRLQNR